MWGWIVAAVSIWFLALFLTVLASCQSKSNHHADCTIQKLEVILPPTPTPTPEPDEEIETTVAQNARPSPTPEALSALQSCKKEIEACLAAKLSLDQYNERLLERDKECNRAVCSDSSTYSEDI